MRFIQFIIPPFVQSHNNVRVQQSNAATTPVLLLQPNEHSVEHKLPLLVISARRADICLHSNQTGFSRSSLLQRVSYQQHTYLQSLTLLRGLHSSHAKRLTWVTRGATPLKRQTIQATYTHLQSLMRSDFKVSHHTNQSNHTELKCPTSNMHRESTLVMSLIKQQTATGRSSGSVTQANYDLCQTGLKNVMKTDTKVLYKS